MVDLNVQNLQVGDNGRISFSGLGSGIDFEAAVDGIIAAKRIPVDRLEAKIETNQAKISDLATTRNLLTAVQESLADLYGQVSFDQSANLFSSKQAFASATREDGGTPSVPTNIIGVSVTSAAAAGNHTIEVLQTARAHRVGSGEFTSITDDLGTARGQAAGSIAGDIEIAGTTIAVLATDSLNDIVDRVNNANTGETPTGVSASIVSTSATENFLVFTVDETGKTLGSDVALSDPDSILENLG
ncbi:MAG: flagellar cap protein FliD N-terminal domain-containing protein, partial [Alphaproteobacteria bacterium]